MKITQQLSTFSTAILLKTNIKYGFISLFNSFNSQFQAHFERFNLKNAKNKFRKNFPELCFIILSYIILIGFKQNNYRINNPTDTKEPNCQDIQNTHTNFALVEFVSTDTSKENTK